MANVQRMRTAADATAPLAMHSAASPDWGTPIAGKELAARVLAPSAFSRCIDLDYASSTYWHEHWPGDSRPRAFLDGSRGKDVLVEADRRRAISGHGCGAGFLNPPGLGGGQMVQDCWKLFVDDWLSGWLKSGVWVGFSLEQLASLQGVADRHPLSLDIVTIIPSRRGRYLLHPDALIALCKKKQARHDKKGKPWLRLQRKIKELRAREDDSPVRGDAPTHSSYISICLCADQTIRKKQIIALRQFLDEQSKIERSWFEKVAIIGNFK